MSTSTLLYLCTVIALSQCVQSSDDLKTTADQLKGIIEASFSESRNHDDAMEYHVKTQQYIDKTFKDNGLTTTQQTFDSSREGTQGTNVVGVLKGTRAGTDKDSVLLVGGHYDTTRETPGVDNNGSGLAALIQILKSLTTSDFSCQNSILFAAFDLKENDVSTCLNGTCGSNAFIKDWFKPYLTENSASFQGAIILDTVMNFDETENSQDSFLTGDEFQTFNDEMTNNNMKGDFLLCIGRSSDSGLTDALKSQWGDDEKYKFMNVQVPLEGPPTEEESKKYEFLLDSDHRPFWSNDQPYKAVYLTDTAGYRGAMKNCYHKTCDNTTTMLTDSNLLFAAKTTQTVKDTIAQLAVCASTSAAVRISAMNFVLFIVLAALASFKFV